MVTIEVSLRRVSGVSSRPFDEIVRRLTATIGHPDMNFFHGAVAAAMTVADLEEVVHGAIGSSELMEFVRFDAGEVLRKERVAPYGSQAALRVARDLDAKIAGLLEAAAY